MHTWWSVLIICCWWSIMLPNCSLYCSWVICMVMHPPRYNCAPHILPSLILIGLINYASSHHHLDIAPAFILTIILKFCIFWCMICIINLCARARTRALFLCVCLRPRVKYQEGKYPIVREGNVGMRGDEFCAIWFCRSVTVLSFSLSCNCASK